MEFIPLSTTYVTILFVGLSFWCVVLKVRKWLQAEKSSSKWLNALQFRYFLCYYTFMAGLTFQGPYVYQRYLDSGITQEQISIVMSTFNIVSSIWGFAVGYFTEILGHKKLIIISALVLSMHATLRFMGGFWCFVLSSALMGVSTASNRVVFEDWLMTVLQNPEAPDYAQATIQENSALIRLFSTLVFTPLSARLTHHFGSASAFAVSSLMFFTSAVIISIYLDDPRLLEKNEKDDDRNSNTSKKKKIGYVNALKSIFQNLRSSPELSILLITDFASSVFTLLYSPRWLAIHQITKKDKLPLSQMSTTNSVALTNGAQIIGALFHLFSSPRPMFFISFLLSLIFVSMILLFYSNKNIVFTVFILVAVCDGGNQTIFRMLRGNIYPRDVRGYILGFLRVPASLSVSLLLMAVKGKDVRYIISLCCGFLSLCVISSFLLYRREKKESQKQ